jgi:hypothetical protein
MQSFSRRDWDKPRTMSMKITGHRAEFQTLELPNTKQECQILNFLFRNEVCGSQVATHLELSLLPGDCTSYWHLILWGSTTMTNIFAVATVRVKRVGFEGCHVYPYMLYIHHAFQPLFSPFSPPTWLLGSENTCSHTKMFSRIFGHDVQPTSP